MLLRKIITLARMRELELLKQDYARLQEHVSQKDAAFQQNAAVVEQQAALLAEQSATIRKQEAKLEAQQLEINRLLQQAFGRRSERYLESPQQLKIDFGDSPEVTDATDGLQQAVDEKNSDDASAENVVDIAGHQRKKKSSRNERLPDNLPRIEIIADVPDGHKVCETHGHRTLIGYDITEKTGNHCHEVPKVRLSGPARMRRGAASPAEQPDRRQPLRHQHCRRNHHREVRISFAVLQAAGSLRRQRLGSDTQYITEHPDSRCDTRSAAR